MDPCGDAGQLHVHGRKGKNKRSTACDDSLKRLTDRRIEGNLRGVKLHIFNGVVLASADVACENLCIDTSAGCLFGQGACLTCLLYVRDVQVFPEQSSMFFLEILFCRRSELA